MKTALLVVSFGTTHLDTLEKTIVQTENELRGAFPELPFYRAFTSQIVCARLQSKYGMEVRSVETALERIAADGYEQVLLQPTLLIPGEEADRLAASVHSSAGKLKIAMGKPLLGEESDMDALIPILKEAYPVPADTALLLMGHGTDHGANSLYEQFNQKLRQDTGCVMRICTLEGIPTFADAVQELSTLPQRKVTLAPLLFVAGEHAKNDMAGEEPDSLCSLLKASGFTVSPVFQGLGQIAAIRKLFVERAKAAAVDLE